MRHEILILSAACVCFLAAPSLHCQDAEPVAIQAGRIITVSGEEIAGGTILFERGKIVAVGKDIPIPSGARVFKYPQGTVLPGLIAVHSTMGLRVPNENVPNAPYISVLDGIDPSSQAVKNALRDGVTAAHVIPANATRIGGQGAVVRTAGRTVDEMVISSPSAIKISLRPPPGETRMQNVAALRRTFLDLYAQVKEAETVSGPAGAVSGRPTSAPSLESIVESKAPWQDISWDRVSLEKMSAEWRPMAELVRGKIQAFIYCATASDVFKAFEVMDSNGLKATLVLGPDAYKLVDVLRSRQNLGPVILDGEMVVWDADPDSGEERRHVTPRALHDAGIRFAIQAIPDPRDQGPRISREGELHLWYQAATLVRLGIPRPEALRAVTATPAKILGLDHRMGTLEVGKDANVAVFSGDPLDARSWVEQVFIEGKEAYRKDKDRELELLLREPERRF